MYFLETLPYTNINTSNNINNQQITNYFVGKLEKRTLS